MFILALLSIEDTKAQWCNYECNAKITTAQVISSSDFWYEPFEGDPEFRAVMRWALGSNNCTSTASWPSCPLIGAIASESANSGDLYVNAASINGTGRTFLNTPLRTSSQWFDFQAHYFEDDDAYQGAGSDGGGEDGNYYNIMPFNFLQTPPSNNVYQDVPEYAIAQQFPYWTDIDDCLQCTWHYVFDYATDPFIQLTNCPGEIVETYAATDTARIPSWAVSLTQGTTYVFSTCGSGFDTYLSLFGNNGYTVLAFDDDGCGNQQSRIYFNCPATGVYFLELTKWLSTSTRGSFTDAFEIHMATVDDQAPTGINAANPLSFDTLYTCSNAEVPTWGIIPPVRNFHDNCSADAASVQIDLAWEYPSEGWEGNPAFNWNFGSLTEEADFSSIYPWFYSTDAVTSGSYSLKVILPADSAFSRFTTSVDFPEQNFISFNFRTSTESGWDFLQFIVDGAVQSQWSGDIDWTYVEFAIPAGIHTLEWRYQKDFSNAGGEDACWIDDIYIPEPIFESVNLSFPETHVRSYAVFDDAGNSTPLSQTIYVGNVDQLLAGGIVNQGGVYSTAALLDLLNTGADLSHLDMYSFQWIDCDDNSAVIIDTAFFQVSENLTGHHFTLRCSFMGACIGYTPCFPENDVTPPSGYIEDLYVCTSGDVPPAGDVIVIDLSDNITLNPQVNLLSEIPGSTEIPQIIMRNYSLTDDAGNSDSIAQFITVANLDMLLATGIQYVDGVLSLIGTPADWALDQYLYQWLDCSNNNAPIIGANSASYTPLTSGSYALQCDYAPFGLGTGSFCFSQSACTELTVSVQNTPSAYFTLYPNPNNTDELHFNYSGAIEKIDIYNVMGDLVLSSNTMGSKSMNIASLSTGNYIVKMHCAEGCLTNPLIVTE